MFLISKLASDVQNKTVAMGKRLIKSWKNFIVGKLNFKNYIKY